MGISSLAIVFLHSWINPEHEIMAGIIAKLSIWKDNSTPRAKIDFTGTSLQLPSSLNTPRAVTRSAVLYTLRTLIQRDIPLNDSCLDPVEIIIEPGSMLSPTPDAAVVGGNVETSQRVIDVLYGCLGVAAASQGTMFNLTFGWSHDSGADFEGRYYETIAGGAGATEGHAGASCVHTHMTNTRITDPEIFERRYPGARIRRFSLRPESGGAGRWRGGDGVIREFKILQPCRTAILSERRVNEPYGAKGGEAGEPGLNTLIRNNERIALEGKVELELKKGDILRIETPGGAALAGLKVTARR